MADEFQKRPDAPAQGVQGKWIYAGKEYSNQAGAVVQYISDDRLWLLKLAQRQRTYMHHDKTCPKKYHPFQQGVICLCGMSDYVLEPIS